jgi:hypothetical protein
MVLIALNSIVRPAPDQSTESDKYLQKHGGGIGFGMRLDSPHHLSGQSLECSRI